MRTLGQNNFSVAILGPGAVGGFLSALFLKKGVSVTCIVNEETGRVISQNGIKLESVALGNYSAWPNIVLSLDTTPDLLFITTKAYSLNEALKRVDPCFVKNTIIVPLLNGIEHMNLLRAFYGRRIVAASIGNVELRKMSPAHIVHTTSSASIWLASDGDISAPLLEKIASFISGIGIKTELLDSEGDVLWRKLVRLNAIACTTSAARQAVGFIRTDAAWRISLVNCVKEAAVVAAAEGVKIDTAAVMAQIDSLPSELGTSVQRDIIAGKPSEIDAIAGAVIRSGARHGIFCPTIEGLVRKINSKYES